MSQTDNNRHNIKDRTPKLKRIKEDELIGFDMKRIEALISKNQNSGRKLPKDLKTIIRREFGKVGRYKREIKRQTTTINRLNRELDKHTELYEKYVNLIKEEEKRFLKIIDYVDPKITIRRDRKENFLNYRGKVYWRISHYKKGRWIEFQIISRKKAEKQNLTEKQIRALGKEKFIQKLIRDDMIGKNL